MEKAIIVAEHVLWDEAGFLPLHPKYPDMLKGADLSGYSALHKYSALHCRLHNEVSKLCLCVLYRDIHLQMVTKRNIQQGLKSPALRDVAHHAK